MEMLAWESSSLVWVCSSNQGRSHVAIVDSNNPNSVIEAFPVCSSHLLCVSSIPGSRFNFRLPRKVQGVEVKVVLIGLRPIESSSFFFYVPRLLLL